MNAKTRVYCAKMLLYVLFQGTSVDRCKQAAVRTVPKPAILWKQRCYVMIFKLKL
jgi:hypothetical protein